ncbi:MAG TPA: hypothetical protein VFA86_03630 [Gammaproteobacteria bacterium]|nr:hypothetical protein [Gammaproteobacteria bacterium]
METIRMLRKILMATMLVAGAATMGTVAFAGTPAAPAGAQAPVTAHSKRPSRKYCRKHPTDPRCKARKR